jgi:sensor domain CHASE-containing protein
MMLHNYFSSLRIRTTVVLSVIFMAMGLACVFVVGLIITDRIDGFERELAAANVRRARNALQQDMKRLDDLLKDWAWWDDTYAFMAAPSEEFLASNVTPDVFRNQGLDAMIFISTAGEVLHVSSLDPESGEFGPPPQDLLHHALKASAAFAAEGMTAGETSLAIVGGNLWIAGCRPVLTSAETGPGLAVDDPETRHGLHARAHPAHGT